MPVARRSAQYRKGFGAIYTDIVGNKLLSHAGQQIPDDFAAAFVYRHFQ